MHQSRIYIAEEDKDFRRRLQRTLTAHGFHVTLFDSGYPIVAMMDNWPDLFLIDIGLPGINGLEVCKWLKSHEPSSNIPVIFLSRESYLKELAASAHADGYIEKPVVPNQLINKVLQYLGAEKAQ